MLWETIDLSRTKIDTQIKLADCIISGYLFNRLAFTGVPPQSRILLLEIRITVRTPRAGRPQTYSCTQ